MGVNLNFKINKKAFPKTEVKLGVCLTLGEREPIC